MARDSAVGGSLKSAALATAILVCGVNVPTRAHMHLGPPQARTLQLTPCPVAGLFQAGLVDVDGHLVGEPDGQGFGLWVTPFSAKPGKKSKSKKTFKEQLR